MLSVAAPQLTAATVTMVTTSSLTGQEQAAFMAGGRQALPARTTTPPRGVSSDLEAPVVDVDSQVTGTGSPWRPVSAKGRQIVPAHHANGGSRAEVNAWTAG
jgi:hypothetical protein